MTSQPSPPAHVLKKEQDNQLLLSPTGVRPKLAASLVLLRGKPGRLQVLMGQRARQHDFMPSIFVYPGGRVDRADHYAPSLGALPIRTQTLLMHKFSARRARALALASIRETFEETGLIIGQKGTSRRNLTHKGWQSFFDKGYMPDLDGIELFGRAITPPRRNKRFDTWFFFKHLSEDQIAPVSDSAELLGVDWFDLDQVKTLKTHGITLLMLDALKDHLEHKTAPSDIFFMHMVRGQFHQERFPQRT